MQQRTSAPTSDRSKKNAAVQLRLGPIFELVEDWRRSQPKIPARAHAIRELLRRQLETEQRNAAS
jgi:hypothetical protein